MSLRRLAYEKGESAEEKAPSVAAAPPERRRLMVEGVVQGIGFRPLVYRLAREQSLTGRVRNQGRGVSIEIQGRPADLVEFARRLRAELPPGGRIDRSCSEELPAVSEERQFVISPSEQSRERSVSLAPDRGVCPACLAEMSDPADRRHGYPFINCTACGPRFTIARELPYDRGRTTMAAFEMCSDCRAEYDDPADRRYHAEPIACPACGPSIWLLEAGATADLENPPTPQKPPEAWIREAVARLEQGCVVAIKGLGGFHLAANARSDQAVRRLRQQKKRPRKPLAVMVRDLETARRAVELDQASEALLRSPAAPIVLAPHGRDCDLSDELAPDLRELGVMLPYTPLHHLLLQKGPDALVMTSGNHPAEPITTKNREAIEHLPADAYVLHDRDIHVANDDSVVRQSAHGPMLVRRSRGYVPEPFDAAHLPEAEVLALGAQLKVTVTTLSRGQMVVGRHLGDLDNVRAEQAFRQELERVLDFAALSPAAVAVDRHPDLASTELAEQAFGHLPLMRIQHHHAHLAAVLFEHGLGPEAQAVGIILDGFGLGDDGAIWGGEILRGGYAGFERLAHLRYVPQPGGDRAALQPHRMATSLLVDAELPPDPALGYDEQIAALCQVDAVSPPTSSTGRLFDGVASILGLAPREQDYEAEAAMLLEAAAEPSCTDGYPLGKTGSELDTRELVRALVADRAELPIRAARFHNGLADGLAAAAQEAGCERVLLGGGCLLNAVLLGRLVRTLRRAGLQVLWPHELPPGDGGLSAGQAACTACMLAQGTRG